MVIGKFDHRLVRRCMQRPAQRERTGGRRGYGRWRSWKDAGTQLGSQRSV